VSAPYTSGTALDSTVFTANTAGTQLGVVGAQAASNAAAPNISGVLHTITVSADNTANVITVYDGTSTAGEVIAKVTCATTVVPQTFTFDVQALVGLFIVISGVTGTGGITVTYI
jgi:hypothetical protein